MNPIERSSLAFDRIPAIQTGFVMSASSPIGIVPSRSRKSYSAFSQQDLAHAYAWLFKLKSVSLTVRLACFFPLRKVP